MPGITLRVRTQLGTWRLSGIEDADTMGALRVLVEKEHNTDLEGRPFSSDAAGKIKFDDAQTVGDLLLANGTMVYALVDVEKTGVHEEATGVGARRITKDGNIIANDHASIASRTGFRPGMMPLRNMKMQWRLEEFIALDAQFEYKLSRAAQPLCSSVTLDVACMQEFQAYMVSSLDFQQLRIGYLYGEFVKYREPTKAEAAAAKYDAEQKAAAAGASGKSIEGGEAGTGGGPQPANMSDSVRVEFLYEPPQNNTDTSFELLDDPMVDQVEAVATALGLVKVGWVFAHPLREDKFNFSGAEVIEAAEQQLIAAGGIDDTPFVTVKVTLDPATGQPFADAFQISKQGMEMAAEGVLEPSPNLGMCAVNETFTAYVENKPVKEVDTDFFIVRVPIKSFESELLVTQFPHANRLGTLQTRDEMKRQLGRAGSKGWTFLSQLADFQLLLYLCQFLDVAHDIPLISRSVVDKSLPLDEGYTLLIRSLAGMD